MTNKEMISQVGEELEYIPDWPGAHQKELRMLYNDHRRASLGKKAVGNKSALDVLRECVTFLRKTYPDAEFKYDRAFFGAAV